MEETEEYYVECEKCGCQRPFFHPYKGKSQCTKCKHVQKEETNRIRINEKRVICSECGEKVAIRYDNRAYPFYMCPTVRCNNMVAVCYENKLYQPLEPLKRSWNKNVENGIKLQNNLSLLMCEDDRSLWVAKIINEVANSEESSFLRFKEEYHKIGLLYNDSEALGYIMWSEEKGEIVLRQLFVLESFRNNGYGTLLIDEWVKNFVNTKFDNFKVQNPVSTTIDILIRLGHFSGDDKTNNKCTLIP